MTDLEKLKHLLTHWIEHNNAHVQTYREWAAKTASSGREDISGILKQITDESEKLNSLFREAMEKI